MKAKKLLKNTKNKNAGLTYLNICTVFSRLGNHREALKCANTAIKYLEKEL